MEPVAAPRPLGAQALEAATLAAVEWSVSAIGAGLVLYLATHHEQRRRLVGFLEATVAAPRAALERAAWLRSPRALFYRSQRARLIAGELEVHELVEA